MSAIRRYKFPAFEVRLQRLNESPGTLRIDTPEAALTYWREKVMAAPWFDRERECCVSVMLNTRYSALGHSLVGIGSINEAVVHPREVFRAAIAVGSYAIPLAHNHPSGDPAPSQADTVLTRRMAVARSSAHRQC